MNAVYWLFIDDSLCPYMPIYEFFTGVIVYVFYVFGCGYILEYVFMVILNHVGIQTHILNSMYTHRMHWGSVQSVNWLGYLLENDGLIHVFCKWLEAREMQRTFFVITHGKYFLLLLRCGKKSVTKSWESWFSYWMVIHLSNILFIKSSREIYDKAHAHCHHPVKICMSVYEIYSPQDTTGQSIPGWVELNQSSDFF